MVPRLVTTVPVGSESDPGIGKGWLQLRFTGADEGYGANPIVTPHRVNAGSLPTPGAQAVGE